MLLQSPWIFFFPCFSQVNKCKYKIKLSFRFFFEVCCLLICCWFHAAKCQTVQFKGFSCITVFLYALKSDLEDFKTKPNGYLQSILEIWIKLCFGYLLQYGLLSCLVCVVVGVEEILYFGSWLAEQDYAVWIFLK